MGLRDLDDIKNFEVGSIVPSLAKNRYNNDTLFSTLGTKFLSNIKTDLNLMHPHYLKILVERLISLNFKESKEADTFFSELQ